ncbi:TPA: hypothetical protein ACIJSX_000914 [Klebsiella pneumoniae]|jgi:hypothetical protein|uniref:hypothetical protein n=1 Tax=Klebsiella pneumoniae complex TaxID=3390273 RepID=UPI00157275A8|nr:hypothetical protein [Klebsiella pneumoniae]EJC6252876.1 hypothetical protein [Klebsiella aerogenes]MEA4578191.1 hypothetical protein [Klebsiella pneumoniae]HCF8768449.1 hypothetical protein [Klebsiella pneumoniae]HDT1161644.1 hypothetical protein [Klebsiella aerogenes]HDZ9724365.1 hypothetical protein [Klebsiella pneumoniae]
MKKCEGVSKLPRRRDAALAVPYTAVELISISDEQKKIKTEKFTSTSLKNKYFKL